jgi:hypothetical protein
VTFNPFGGSLPAGFTYGSVYYVISTGLSGSAFQVSSKVGGTAITAGSAPVGTINVVYGANVALNGTLVNTTSGIAVLDNPRRILITTSDTTTKFTITGTAANGTIQSETFLVSTATYSALDYATVTSITVNQAPTGAVTVGTNGTGSTPWVRTDASAFPNVSIMTDVTGTVNYTVQSTSDDPNSPTNSVLPSSVTWQSTNDPNGVAATGAIQTNYLFSPTFIRILLNSGSGSVSATVIQYGVVSR